MTDTERPAVTSAPQTSARQRPGNPPLRVAAAVACALLGFVLVAQVRSTEELGTRLEAEREEDLARILADLSAESDRLQAEITSLRLTLASFKTTAEGEQAALRSLERRLDELRVLAGVAPVEGEGIVMTVEDPSGQVTQDLLVDTIQELRDAGAEAIAVNDVRLIASSAFVTSGSRLLLDGQALQPPYRIMAVGPAETMAKALDIPGGAVQTLETRHEVRTRVETRAEVFLPARHELAQFIYGEPVPTEEAR